MAAAVQGAGAAAAAAVTKNDKATLHPFLKNLWTASVNQIQAVLSKIRVSGLVVEKGQFPTGYFILILLLTGLALYWYFGAVQYLETPTNIARILKQNVDAALHYATGAGKRKGLPDLYKSLIARGYTDENLGFTNFYISTVNATGLFFGKDSAVNGVVSPDAARLAVMGGARCFVFDIWPDLSPDGDFGPTIEAMDEGSLWRRTTLNALPLTNILQAVVQEALPPVGNIYTSTHPGSLLRNTKPSGQGHQDPVVLYLRFRGVPRPSTFDGVADVLASTILPYRLESSFNNCRGADTLFKVPIPKLFSKVIVMSNTRGSGKFMDFVNFAPKTGIPMEYEASQLRLITGDAAAEAKKKILMNPSFVAPLSEAPLAASNDYDYTLAQNLGIQCVAMNFWNSSRELKNYMEMFETYSYAMKPADLCYTVSRLTPPQMPPNPDWGNNALGQAGAFRPPAAIQFPT